MRTAAADDDIDQRREQFGEVTPLLVKPRAFELRQQRPVDDRQRLRRELVCPLWRTPLERSARSGGGRPSDLDIDPGAVTELQEQRASDRQTLRPEHGAHPGQHAGQRGIRVAWRPFGPKRVDQFVPARDVPARQDKKRKEQSALTRREPPRHADTVELHA